MSKVNFVNEFNMFMRYARDNNLPLRERMLWIALFYVANDRATYNAQTTEYDWPDGFIQVSNNELNLYCCLDKRAVETLRNTLKQRGLIDFIAGQKNKRNPAYKINYLSVNVGYKIVPNPPPNITPNNDPNDDPNPVPNDAPNPSPLYINKINTGIEGNYIPSAAEEDEEDPYINAYARVSNLVHAAYQDQFGEPPAKAELESMTRVILARNLSQIATDVIVNVAKAAPKNRLAYLIALTENWETEYIRTAQDLAEYQVLRDMGDKLYPDPGDLAVARLQGRLARKDKYSTKEESA